MNVDFEAARFKYIKIHREFYLAVMDLAASSGDKKVEIMDDIARDLSKIEAAGWDAAKEDEE